VPLLIHYRCQMGTSPSTSVIDPRGKVWGTDNLFVADAVWL
jgi:long-chain-alcohol oxidase